LQCLVGMKQEFAFRHSSIVLPLYGPGPLTKRYRVYNQANVLLGIVAFCAATKEWLAFKEDRLLPHMGRTRQAAAELLRG